VQNHFVVSQVSPYVVPFIPKNFASDRRTLLGAVSGLVFAEMRHRMSQVRLVQTVRARGTLAHAPPLAPPRFDRQLAVLKLLPRWAEGVLSTLEQVQRGDIVIVPDLSIADYKDIVAYPTDEFVQKWCAGPPDPPS